MTTPNQLADPPLSQQLVQIATVDPVGNSATGYTRQKTAVYINLRYPVGSVHVVPCVGEQWVVTKVGINWALDRKLPKNTNIPLNVADNPVQGLTQIGSSGVGSGPTLIDGSQATVLSNLLQLGPNTLYRDSSGALQSSTDGGTTWTNVVSSLSNRETPSGTIDGVNATFTLAHTPISGTDMVFVNGLLLASGYTISGTTLTFTSAPAGGSTLLITYRY